MTISSRSVLFLRRGWLSKSAPTSVAMYIRRGFHLSFCPLALSWKGHVSSTTNCTLLSRRDRASAWWCTRLWVIESHLDFVQEWRGGGWFLAGNHCHDTSHHQRVPPRHVISGFCLRSPSTEGPPSGLFARPPGITQMPSRPSPALP